MEKYVDLHCHSKYSDGKYSVEKLIELAKLNDVDFLSITDHDNIDSAKDIIKYRNDGQIQLINGIELSTVFVMEGEEIYMHLLGYDYNPTDTQLLSEMERYRCILFENNTIFLRRLRKNISLIPSCIFEEFDLYSYKLGDTQIREILVKNKFDKNFIDSFVNKAKKFMPEYQGYELDAKVAIEILRKSGGISVLAHPNKIKISNTAKEDLINILAKTGLTGIETYHSSFSSADFGYFKYLAAKNQLLESVGSDYHFDTINDKIILGKGINNNLCQSDCSIKKILLQRRRQ